MGCRFTKDTESVDTSVSYSVQSFMTCSISVFGAILVVTAVTPTIIVAIALLGIVYYRVQVSTHRLSCLSFKHHAAVSVGNKALMGGWLAGHCPERFMHRIGGGVGGGMGGAWWVLLGTHIMGQESALTCLMVAPGAMACLNFENSGFWHSKLWRNSWSMCCLSVLKLGVPSKTWYL